MGSTEQKKIRRSHLHLLLKLARADNRMHINEDKFMRKAAVRLGLTEVEFDELKHYPERFDYVMPRTKSEKMSCFYDLLNLMKVDEDIAEEEIDFIKETGLLLGIDIQLTDDLIQIMERFIGKEVPVEIFEEAEKKYLN